MKHFFKFFFIIFLTLFSLLNIQEFKTIISNENNDIHFLGTFFGMSNSSSLTSTCTTVQRDFPPKSDLPIQSSLGLDARLNMPTKLQVNLQH